MQGVQGHLPAKPAPEKELSQRSLPESSDDVSWARATPLKQPLPPAAWEARKHSCNLKKKKFFLTWAHRCPNWECVSQGEVETEIFDDMEIKNTHPPVLSQGFSVSVQSASSSLMSWWSVKMAVPSRAPRSTLAGPALRL